MGVTLTRNLLSDVFKNFTVSASAKELIELLWNAIGGKFNTVQEGDNSWFRKTVKVFSRVPWLVGYIYIFFIISSFSLTLSFW